MLAALSPSHNAFWGPLPEQLAALASLGISGNGVEGTVPPGLAALRGLQLLDLRGNCFSGVLHPALFRNLTGLHYLDLSGNRFLESPLPPELGGMASLRWQFSGAIPDTFLGLEQLDASMNGLTGTVPLGFGLKFEKLLPLDLVLLIYSSTCDNEELESPRKLGSTM